MRLEWLEDILAVAETGSLSEAAERRHLTQSAFSRRIQAIEDYIGVELFDRGRKPVHLRPGTGAQREQMQRLAAELRQLVEELRQGERRARNRVVMTSQHALTTALMPGLIRRIEAERTDIQIRLRSANRDECFALLLARQADLAVVYDRPGLDIAAPWRGVDYIEDQLIGRDQLVPVATPALAAEVEAALGSGQMADVPVVAYPPEVFLGRVVQQDVRPLLPSTVRLVPRVETALTPAAVELAAEGLGVAWIPRQLLRRMSAGREFTELSDLLPYARLNMVALRLAGQSGDAGQAVWSILAGLPPP